MNDTNGSIKILSDRATATTSVVVIVLAALLLLADGELQRHVLHVRLDHSLPVPLQWETQSPSHIPHIPHRHTRAHLQVDEPQPALEVLDRLGTVQDAAGHLCRRRPKGSENENATCAPMA